MSALCIDEVYPKTSENPLLVTFQNGYTTDEFTSKNCMLYEDKTTHLKALAADVCDLLYAGNEEEDAGKTLVLARNKITGKVRLIEVGNIEVKPVLKDHLDSVLDTSRLELSRKFGSKKQKKMMEQREKLKVNTETVVSQMHNVTVNIAEDQVDLSSYTTTTDSEDFYIPPINREAKDVSEVYDLYKILTKEQYESIYTEFEHTDYTSNLIEWVKNIVSNKTLRAEQKVLALYASSLFKLYSTNLKEISKKSFTACPESAILNDVILKNFTHYSNNKRNRSLQLKDKSLCHAIIFLLLINEYKYSAEELCKHANMAIRTLTTKIKVTGATMVTSGSKKVVQLKLPLATAGFARRKSAKF